MALNRIRRRNPRATVIYADYYSAAMSLFSSPQFSGGKLAFIIHAHLFSLFIVYGLLNVFYVRARLWKARYRIILKLGSIILKS